MNEHNRKPGQVVRTGKARAQGEPGFTFGPPVSPPAREYTVVVCGADGKTSTLVAQVARALGLDFGAGVNDRLVDKSFVEGTQQERAGIVRMRNAAKAVWGWRARPVDDLASFLPLLRNPRLVYVWQDPLTRSLASPEHSADPLTGLARTVDDQMNRLGALAGGSCPVFVVSMENARTSPRRFILGLCAFMGMKVPANLWPVVQLLRPAPRGELVTEKQVAARAGSPAAAKKKPDPERRARRLERRTRRQKAKQG